MSDRDRRAARDFFRDQCVTASLPYAERNLAALLTRTRAEGAAEAIEEAARFICTADPCHEPTCLSKRIRALAPAGLVAVDGVALIAEERRRQISVEGWTPDHDAEHARGELVEAAISYAKAHDENAFAGGMWPWDRSWWKPKDRVRNLVRAGALIAAEIDRIRAAARKGE